MEGERRKRRPLVAAVLSLLGLGIGQLYNGQLRRALAFLAAGWSAFLGLALVTGFAAPAESFLSFAAANVIALVILGIWIASIVTAFLSARRIREIELRSYNKWYIYLAVGLALAVLSEIVPVRVGFAIYSMPARSMLPILQPGDHIVAVKDAYRDRLPERGEIAIFKLPSDNKTDYIKRIVGLPGDHVQIRGGILHINGEAVERTLIGDYMVDMGFVARETATLYVETLPGGKTHYIIERSDSSALDDTPVFTVPPGHYFAMGDNRDNSQDSRASLVGFIPAENLTDRPRFVFYSTAARDAGLLQIWRWLPATRIDRIGARIQ
jgi:signal peptidase I